MGCENRGRFRHRRPLSIAVLGPLYFFSGGAVLFARSRTSVLAVNLAPLRLSWTRNIGCSMTWSEARIVCWPFGPVKLQPSRAEIIFETSMVDPCETARTII